MGNCHVAAGTVAFDRVDEAVSESLGDIVRSGRWNGVWTRIPIANALHRIAIDDKSHRGADSFNPFKEGHSSFRIPPGQVFDDGPAVWFDERAEDVTSCFTSEANRMPVRVRSKNSGLAPNRSRTATARCSWSSQMMNAKSPSTSSRNPIPVRR